MSAKAKEGGEVKRIKRKEQGKKAIEKKVERKGKSGERSETR